MPEKEVAKNKLRSEYFELINLVEEYHFNKENAATIESKEAWQDDIEMAEIRINEILIDVSNLDS